MGKAQSLKQFVTPIVRCRGRYWRPTGRNHLESKTVGPQSLSFKDSEAAFLAAESIALTW